jgi:alanyl-tRNA synthetase
VHDLDEFRFVITDRTPFFAETGGQVGDTGTLAIAGESRTHPVVAVQSIQRARAHVVAADAAVAPGDIVTLRIDPRRRRPIEAHHTATHLLHWALHELVSRDATQQGSQVDEDRLRFDFNSGALTREQIERIERLVNERISCDDPVSWGETAYAAVKPRSDIMQFFGDKYGDTVRVVQIGGAPGALDGYSMELCGGTHVRHTGAIGLFKIGSEGAIAAGVRRIEAFCGEAAWRHLREVFDALVRDGDAAAAKLAAANEHLARLGTEPVEIGEAPRIITAMLVEGDVDTLNRTLAAARQKLDALKHAAVEAEKRVAKLETAAAAKQADAALALVTEAGTPVVATFNAPAPMLQELLNGLRKLQFPEAAVMVVDDGAKLHLGVFCGPAARARGIDAGAVLRETAAVAGGKGGGKPDLARGAAPARAQLANLAARARTLIGAPAA